MTEKNKFNVLCGLAAVWVILLIAIGVGHLAQLRNVWMFISLLCVGWFAYWTVTFIRSGTDADKPSNQSEPNENSKEQSPK